MHAHCTLHSSSLFSFLIFNMESPWFIVVIICLKLIVYDSINPRVLNTSGFARSYKLRIDIVLRFQSFRYQVLPLSVHGDTHVLNLVVAAQLQQGQHTQAYPTREGGPRSKLKTKERFRIDYFGFYCSRDDLNKTELNKRRIGYQNRTPIYFKLH